MLTLSVVSECAARRAVVRFRPTRCWPCAGDYLTDPRGIARKKRARNVNPLPLGSEPAASFSSKPPGQVTID